MGDPMHTLKTADDPRSVSDHKVREEHLREEVEKWREEAQLQHQRWREVMKNRYGKE
jgi:hypothetical protein